jgi:hypothetical protein
VRKSNLGWTPRRADEKKEHALPARNTLAAGPTLRPFLSDLIIDAI